MSAWRERCDWCGWPLVPHPEAGCWDGNCSMRPIPEQTPAQQQVLELKQEIRRLERERPQVNHSEETEILGKMAGLHQAARLCFTTPYTVSEPDKQEIRDGTRRAIHAAILAAADQLRHVAGKKP